MQGSEALTCVCVCRMIVSVATPCISYKVCLPARTCRFLPDGDLSPPPAWPTASAPRSPAFRKSQSHMSRASEHTFADSCICCCHARLQWLPCTVVGKIAMPSAAYHDGAPQQHPQDGVPRMRAGLQVASISMVNTSHIVHHPRLTMMAIRAHLLHCRRQSLQHNRAAPGQVPAGRSPGCRGRCMRCSSGSPAR